MSGLVFVRDALGCALMPTSAAYARTLLRQRKAQLEPHPIFAVIHLTRTVAAPIVRPVLLVIVLHRRTAELFLLVDNVRAAPGFVPVLVDLSSSQNHSIGHLGADRGLVSKRQPSFAAPTLGIPSSSYAIIARRHAQTLANVITLLQSLLPVSYITFLRAPVASPTPRQLDNWTERLLIHNLAARGKITTLIDRAHILTSAVPPTLVRAFIDVTARRIPLALLVVASPAASNWRIQQENLQRGQQHFGKKQPYKRVYRDRAFNKIEQGRLCSIRLDGRSVTGTIYRSYPDGRLTLRVVRRADPQGVVWGFIRVQSTIPRRLWPSHSVLWLSNRSPNLEEPGTIDSH